MYGIWGLVGSKIKVELARRHLPYFLRENGVFFLFFFLLISILLLKLEACFWKDWAAGLFWGFFYLLMLNVSDVSLVSLFGGLG